MTSSLRTSPDQEKNAFYVGLLDRCVSAVVDAVGEKNIRAILMIGAPARSEVTVTGTPKGLFSLSDIDLVCACREAADAQDLRGRLRDTVAALNRELVDRCAGVDVTMKTEQQLASPRPLISSYEMVRSPVVIWGDEKTASTLGDVDIADIPKSESLVLIHNRVLEELLHRPRNTDADLKLMASLFSLYATAKLVLDAITAHLFIRNSVPTGFRDRVGYFLDDVLMRPESSGIKKALDPYLEELPAWAEFKTTGDLGPIAARLGESAIPEALDRLAMQSWSRYVAYAEVFWRSILGDVVRTDLTNLRIESVARVYQRVESFPRSVVRTRRRVIGGRAPSGLFSRPGALLRSRFGSPKLLSYLITVLVYLSYSREADWDRIDRLIRIYCPFELPGGFRELSKDEKRAVLVDRIALMHRTVLLGRKDEET
ncbi:MAG: hypothetical protein JXB46_04420 [Candidatus Eisenbacteria bacterium]|nr:hypothetical protein [Candidatus Eisenbacteria bacterium]